MVEISPAILTNDISDFRKKYAELFALHDHFHMLHVDFGDGVFVDSQTVMPKDLLFLANSPLTLTAHFMTYHPANYLRAAEAAGFKYALVHFEAFLHKHQLDETLMFGEHLGLKMGLVLNPETPLHAAAKYIQKIDLVQLMAIHPGRQGLQFMPQTLQRVKELRMLRKNVIICVDGGVKVGVAKQLAQAGANILVAGSAILKSENESEAIKSLKRDTEPA